MTQKDQNPSKAAKFNSPAEPSGTFHGSSPRGSFSHPFLQALSPPKRDFLFRTRNNNPTRPTNFIRKIEVNPHQVGLGAMGALSRAPNTNNNLLLRPLVVATHLPINISHRAPPVLAPNPNPNPNPAGGGARSSGLYSGLGTYLLRSLGTRVPNGDAHQARKGGVHRNTTSISSDRVLFDDGCTVEASDSPRKKAKRSEEDHGSSEGSTFVVIDNSGFDLISYPTSSFMSYCCNCDKKLKHNEDIYILRGDMAFCSDECREREIFNQEKRERVAEASSSVSRVITRNRSLRELSPEGYDGLPR